MARFHWRSVPRPLHAELPPKQTGNHMTMSEMGLFTILNIGENFLGSVLLYDVNSRMPRAHHVNP